MLEQPKLLRRPLPPKLLPELRIPRKKTQKGRIPTQHGTKAITSTNDEDKNFPSSNYSRGQKEAQTKDIHLLDQISHGRTETHPKDAQFQILGTQLLLNRDHHGQTRSHPKDMHLLPDQDHRGETQSQSKDTQQIDQNLTRDLAIPGHDHRGSARFPFQKDSGSSHMEIVGQEHDDSLPDLATTTSAIEKVEITPSGLYSSSRIPIQIKVHNLSADEIILRDFSITSNSSGSASFPLNKYYRPSSMQLLASQKVDPTCSVLPEFSLESLSSHDSHAKISFMKPVVSHYNCEKLTSRLISEERRSRQTEISTMLLSSNTDLPFVLSRKPQRQSEIEIALAEKMKKASLLEHTLEDEGNASVTDSLTFHAHEKRGRMFSEEMVVEPCALDDDDVYVQGIGYKTILTKQDEEEELMDRAKNAVFYCLMHQKTGLSLKAYFLFHLPDLTPLVNTLVYLNLSFSNLQFFPREVYNLQKLQVLKVRNNPIKEIPDDIHKLRTLRKFIISFNLLSVLPTGLFSLPYLWYLDVAYNDISVIPSEIKNLRALEYLDVEGNQLCVLPGGVLKLPLKSLRVENNFMHPFLWNESCQNQPQRLTDLAAFSFSKNNLGQRYKEIPKDIQNILCNFTLCDYCNGPLYGQGLHCIRTQRSIFRSHRLPFLFNACSSSCYRSFMSQTAAMSQIFYRDGFELQHRNW
ncbi:leucine-rich repeat-containing protein 63 isoform B [Alligator mississippiensis]|uniref:Leucine-rich repeat-containing protein 63 isoform B n=1 Tax=Alligator mississippiensis TaxID=8496 RepID=A0A151MHK2_ALLMI|nr:leucine-rich repeat-containing protein 63 isoform B [Alligator mississippiensis]